MRQFFNSIKQGVVCPVYLFYGEQDFLKDEAVAALSQLIAPASDSNDWNIEFFDGSKTAVDVIINATVTVGFFTGKRLIVIKDAPWFSDKVKDEAALDQLEWYLDNPSDNSILIFIVRGGIDKRRRLVKKIRQAGRVIEFGALGYQELMIWLKRRFKQKGFVVSSQALEHLMMLAGDNLAYLNNEIDKICLYCAGRSTVELADMEQVASRGSILEMFKLIDAVADRKAELSLHLYQEMLKQGESEQKILAMLGKQLRDVLAVKELYQQGLSRRNISEQLSLHPFVVKKSVEKSAKFTRGQLIKALEMLLAVDIANKGGQGDLRSMLQLTILRICV
ncbi:MAG: DNA polymerase III subunit delta [Bacillota bacterium]|jgi:DNA polymerase-3 subunit delta